MKIGFDVDGTLTDMNYFLRKNAIPYFNRMGIQCKNIEASAIEEMFEVDSEKASKFWKKYFIKYCMTCKFREGTKNEIDKIKASGDEVHIVTSRYASCKNNYLGKLSRYLLKASFKKESISVNSFTFTDDDDLTDKLNACIANHFDIVVEDNPNHIKLISEKMNIPVIVMDAPNNRGIDNENIFRITSISELQSTVEKIKKVLDNKAELELEQFDSRPKIGLPSKDKPWEREYIKLGIRKYVVAPETNKFNLWRMKNKWYPDSIAYKYCYGKIFKNSEYEKLVYNVVASLVKLGVKEGMIITIVAANLVEYKLIDEACNLLGVTLNVLHPYTKYQELDKRLKNLDSNNNSNIIFILDSTFSSSKDYEKLKNSMDKIIILNPKDNMTVKGMIEYLIDEHKSKSALKKKRSSSKKSKIKYDSQVISFKNFVRLGKDITDVSQYFSPINLDRPTKILYTGGTTSNKPKGIILTDRNYVSMITGYEKLANFNRDEIMETVTPVFHGFGDCNCTDMPKVFGVTVELFPKFNGYTFIRKLLKSKTRINIMCTPTLFKGLASNKRFDLVRNLNYGYLCTGGALLTNSSKQELQEAYNHEFVVGYGATETLASTLFTFVPDDGEGYIGIPLPGVDIKIVKPGTIDEIGYDELGEICVSGPMIFKQYYNNDDDTKNALKFHEDGKIWYHTSDLGTINKKGHVFYKARIDDCVTYNGYNVYLDDIDTILEKNNLVLESLTIANSDDYHGFTTISYVVLKDSNIDLGEAEKQIYGYLGSSSLPYYSIPKRIVFVPEIQKSIYGKKSRALMKKNLDEEKGGKKYVKE